MILPLSLLILIEVSYGDAFTRYKVYGNIDSTNNNNNKGIDKDNYTENNPKNDIINDISGLFKTLINKDMANEKQKENVPKDSKEENNNKISDIIIDLEDIYNTMKILSTNNSVNSTHDVKGLLDDLLKDDFCNRLADWICQNLESLMEHIADITEERVTADEVKKYLQHNNTKSELNITINYTKSLNNITKDHSYVNTDTTKKNTDVPINIDNRNISNENSNIIKKSDKEQPVIENNSTDDANVLDDDDLNDIIGMKPANNGTNVNRNVNNEFGDVTINSNTSPNIIIKLMVNVGSDSKRCAHESQCSHYLRNFIRQLETN